VDEDGTLVTGDPDVLGNWVGYGAPVVAAAGGSVVSTYDELEDQVPGVFPDMSRLSPMENTGNYVIVAHDDGTYALYAHLKPGSVVVESGQRVEVGETLAQVGNSGGSQAPHLHFGLIDRVPPAAANGIPFAFDRFMVTGVTDSSHLLEAIEGQASFPRDEDGPVPHESELPLSYVMVDFPD
jgi:murein DD-endopeptidase MepM/ murein hydrolase activator NlpD